MLKPQSRRILGLTFVFGAVVLMDSYGSHLLPVPDNFRGLSLLGAAVIGFFAPDPRYAANRARSLKEFKGQPRELIARRLAIGDILAELRTRSLSHSLREAPLLHLNPSRSKLRQRALCESYSR